jgi:MFS family permease
VYAVGAASAAIWSFIFFPLLDTQSVAIIVLAAVVALVTHAAMYGPQSSFIAEMFSTKLRYSGASMGYQIAGIVGGGIAPIISIALVRVFHSAFAVSVYVLAMMILTLIALKFAPETSRNDLKEEHPDSRGPAPWDPIPAKSN